MGQTTCWTFSHGGFFEIRCTSPSSMSSTFHQQLFVDGRRTSRTKKRRPTKAFAPLSTSPLLSLLPFLLVTFGLRKRRNVSPVTHRLRLVSDPEHTPLDMLTWLNASCRVVDRGGCTPTTNLFAFFNPRLVGIHVPLMPDCLMW